MVFFQLYLSCNLFYFSVGIICVGTFYKSNNLMALLSPYHYVTRRGLDMA